MARPQLSALLEPRGNQEDTVKVGEAPTAEEPTPPVQIEATPEPQAERPTTQPRRPGRSKAPKSNGRPKADALPPSSRCAPTKCTAERAFMALGIKVGSRAVVVCPTS